MNPPDVFAEQLGLRPNEPKIVRVEMVEERAQDYARQAAAICGKVIRFRLSRRTVRADNAVAIVYVVTAKLNSVQAVPALREVSQ